MLIKYLKTHFFISRPKHSVAWMNTPPNCKKKNPLFGFYLQLITFLFYWFAWNLYIFLDYLSLKMAAPAAWSNLTCSSAWTHPFRCRNSLHPFSTSFRDPWRLELTPPVTEGEAGNPENRKPSRGKMQFPQMKVLRCVLVKQGAEGGERRVVPGGAVQALWAESDEQRRDQTHHPHQPALWVWRPTFTPIALLKNSLTVCWCVFLL